MANCYSRKPGLGTCIWMAVPLNLDPKHWPITSMAEWPFLFLGGGSPELWNGTVTCPHKGQNGKALSPVELCSSGGLWGLSASLAQCPQSVSCSLHEGCQARQGAPGVG